MEAICKWINDKIVVKHPVVVATIAHYNMARIHSFDGGNGRGARIPMNLILMKKSYPVTIIKNENRRKYPTSLNRADIGDINPFLKFISDSMIDTEKIVIDELNRLSEKYA